MAAPPRGRVAGCLVFTYPRAGAPGYFAGEGWREKRSGAKAIPPAPENAGEAAIVRRARTQHLLLAGRDDSPGLADLSRQLGKRSLRLNHGSLPPNRRGPSWRASRRFGGERRARSRVRVFLSLRAEDNRFGDVGLPRAWVAGGAAVGDGLGRLIDGAGFGQAGRAHHDFVDTAHRRPRHATFG
jgi:hypothetical protein